MKQTHERRRRLLFVILLAVSAASCSEKEVRVSYDHIGGASPVLGKVRSACELAQTAEQAGRYRVDSLTGVYEEFPVNSGNWEPQTYVELSLVDGWTKSAADLTARITGGPFPDGSTALHFIELSRGEEVGLIIDPPHAWNASFHFLETTQVFREEGGELTNGYLRSSQDELSRVVGRAVDSDQCADDIVYRPVDDAENGAPLPEDPQVHPGDMGTSEAGG